MIEQLPDTANGQQDTSLDEVAMGAKAMLVLWICNHCPFVLAIIGKHPCNMPSDPVRPSVGLVNQTFGLINYKCPCCADGLVEVAKEFENEGLATVAISANSVKTHPQVKGGTVWEVVLHACDEVAM